MATTKRRVIIVGAGMAGLSAARELSRSGLCEVMVLEAMDIPGGRIHTLKGFAPNVIELGATWIHGSKSNPVYDFAKKHNLLSKSYDSSGYDETATWYIDDESEDACFQTEDGQKINPKLALDAKRMYGAIQKRLADVDPYKFDPHLNVANILRRDFAGELRRKKIKDIAKLDQYWLMYEHFCMMEAVDLGCNNLEEVQVRGYLISESLDGFYYITLGEDGFQGVLDKMLEDIPASCIQYNSPVTQIRYAAMQDGGNDDVSVTCEDGRAFSCSHVIVTASIGFLQENLETLFEPSLPNEKQEALKTFPYGTVDKIFLRFIKPFWKSEDFEVNFAWNPSKDADEKEEKAQFYRMISGFEQSPSDDSVLVGWVYGNGARYAETLSEDELKQSCMVLLRRFLNDPSIPDPDKVLCTRWHSNKYQRGSYGAFLPPGATGKEFEIMNAPVYRNKMENGHKMPVLLFAGEAYHEVLASTVHAAMISGSNQAKVLIKYLSN